jgi:2'-5' RNA ligase
LEKEKRPFRPHLTILRAKKDSFQEVKPKVLEILKQYKFSLYPNKLRFYVAVDNNFQIPLVDLSIG